MRRPRVDRAKARPVRGWAQRMAREAAQQEQRLAEMRDRLRQDGWSRLPDVLPEPPQLDPAVVHAEFLELSQVQQAGTMRRDSHPAYMERDPALTAPWGEAADLYDADSFVRPEGGPQ